jgi:uncharacterized membrane protein
MLWLVLSLVTAFSEATKDLFSKKALEEVDPYVTAWALSAFSFVLILPLSLLTGVPEIGRHFWYALAIQSISLTITHIIYMKAIKSSPLSLTLPMLTLDCCRGISIEYSKV